MLCDWEGNLAGSNSSLLQGMWLSHLKYLETSISFDPDVCVEYNTHGIALLFLGLNTLQQVWSIFILNLLTAIQ